MNYAQSLRRFREDAVGADLVSFDLFDTLLIRSLRKPTDLFCLVARDLQSKSFPEHAQYSEVRVQAERKARAIARSKGRPEISLQEIYALIDPEFIDKLSIKGITLDAVKDLEVYWEWISARPEPLIAEVFRELISRGCRVAIVSDMYLSSDVLKKMVEKIGIFGHECIVVSCEHSASKADGSIWAKIRASFGLDSSSRIVHIGDHPHSDGSVARAEGIHAHVIPALSDRYPAGRLGEDSHWFIGACESLLRGHMLDQNLTVQQLYWLEIAYLLVLPIAIGMAKFIADFARGVDSKKVFFLARDGLIFKLVYDALDIDGAPTSAYVWASRRCLNVASITRLDEHTISFLTSGADRLTPGQCLERIGLDPNERYIRLAIQAHFKEPGAVINPQATPELVRLFRSLEPEILARAKYERDGLNKHLEQVGMLDAKNAIVVDLGWHGSLQRSLVRLGRELRRPSYDLFGLYLGTASDTPKQIDELPANIIGWLFDRGQTNAPFASYKLKMFVNAIELLFSAPGVGVDFVRYDNGALSPVGRLNPEEEKRIAIATLIHDAVKKAVPSLREMAFLVDDVEFRRLAISQISRFTQEPTRADAVMFSEVSHAEGFGATRYWPLVEPSYNGFNPKLIWKTLKKTGWRRAYLAGLNPTSRWLNYCAHLADRAAGKK